MLFSANLTHTSYWLLTGGFLATFAGCRSTRPAVSTTAAASSVTIRIDPARTYQTIAHFGASDAWACQFVGQWPDARRNAIADLLFSQDQLRSGQPKGIGLSLWRFNIGAGTAGQGTDSGIRDEWRRADSFLTADSNYDWTRQAGQVWFLRAARQRGVA